MSDQIKIPNTIAVVDYGMGNLHSAKKALEKVAGPDQRVFISDDATEILSAERVVVPGVGAIRDCMAAVNEKGFNSMIRTLAESDTPLLGICIGMQMLLQQSEENDGVECLGLFPQQVENFSKFPAVENAHLKVPHMGWNRVKQSQHPLWKGIEDNAYFYFVHSFCAQVSDEHTVGVCEYGVPFSAVMAKDNIFAVQFHPEKSSDNGLKLLENFVKWDGKFST